MEYALMDLNKSMGSGAPAADRTIDVAIGIAGFDFHADKLPPQSITAKALYPAGAGMHPEKVQGRLFQVHGSKNLPETRMGCGKADFTGRPRSDSGCHPSADKL